MSTTGTSTRSPARVAVTVGALGVVFGDIGTSPIYPIQTIVNPNDPHPVAATTDSVYGLLSIIIWSVTIAGDDQVRDAGSAGRQRGRGRHPGADHPDPEAGLHRRASDHRRCRGSS
jgi:hypothetical protein